MSELRDRLVARWRRDFPIGPKGPEEAIDAMLDELGWDDAPLGKAAYSTSGTLTHILVIAPVHALGTYRLIREDGEDHE